MTRDDLVILHGVPRHGLRGQPTNNPVGRPPVDFLVPARGLLDAIDHRGMSIRGAAQIAGVSQRTFGRALLAAGWVVALRHRDPVDVPELPRPRAHYLGDLLVARDANAERVEWAGCEQFSRLVGLSARSQYRIWAVLDEMAEKRAHGHPMRFVELPGESPSSPRGVDPDREPIPYTIPEPLPSTTEVEQRRYLASRHRNIYLSRDQIIDRYNKGATIAELARMAHCSPSTMQRRMTDWGIERRGRGPDAKTSRPWRADVAGGYSI